MFKKFFNFGKKDEEKEEVKEKLEENESKPVEKIEESAPVEEEKPENEGFFKGFFKGLTKTRENISKKIDNILASFTKIDDELFEMLEDALILADIGGQTTMEIVDRLKDRVKEKRITEPADIKVELNSLLKDIMKEDNLENKMDIENTPLVILVVGVNGVGKTTSIGKLANKYKNAGKEVLLVAADTFRAAAIEQLGEWADRAKVPMIAHDEGADPAAVVFDGMSAAKARKSDIIICDTAGRLHNKKNLMNELNKIYRVIEKEYPEAKSETLIVLDATTGQNAMNQAKEFNEAADISGVILTKMDGTAKGGVVVRIQTEMKIPVKYIGLGEQIADLKEFDVDNFVDGII